MPIALIVKFGQVTTKKQVVHFTQVIKVFILTDQYQANALIRCNANISNLNEGGLEWKNVYVLLVGAKKKYIIVEIVIDIGAKILDVRTVPSLL